MKSIFLDKREDPEDVYAELLDADEVADWEEAFMKGYQEAG